MIEKDIEYIRCRLTEADIWGQLAEEAAELSQAALKMQRHCLKRNPPRKDLKSIMDDVVEEHADLALCFKILNWNDKEKRSQIMEKKAKRWAQCLMEVGNGG